jgi:solute carrier family 35 protein F5
LARTPPKDERKELIVNDSGVGSESDDLRQTSPTPNGASTHINDLGSAPGGGEETSHHEYDRLREAPPLLEAKSGDDAAGEAIGYTFWQIARTSLIFCPVWFAANYSYNKSLSLTSVSSNTILSSTSSTALVFSCVLEGWLTHHFVCVHACVC